MRTAFRRKSCCLSAELIKYSRPLYGADDGKNSTEKMTEAAPFRLDCRPGELRHFNYESSTRVWGSSDQQVRIRASLKLRCMESFNNNTLKYMIEVMNVTSEFGDGSQARKEIRRRKKLDGKLARMVYPGELTESEARQFYEQARVEPLLEEVGEVANRVRRSVSGWFSKTWVTVKDFFSNIFSSSERSTINREQAMRDSGVDIAHYCKAGKDKVSSNGLPIDDSVFEDLEPKYSIGASLDPVNIAYEFDQRDAGENDYGISFFDDPKPFQSRLKRAIDSGPIKTSQSSDYDRMLKLPFVLVQYRSGKIMEVRFSVEENDLSIKNFKRHLCDLFATNLDKNKSLLNEVTPMGQHPAKYLIDSSNNSAAIKQSLMREQSSQQLVRVMALAGMQSVVNEDRNSDDGTVEGRNPGSLSDSISVLRSINSTNQIHSHSAVASNIDQMEVRVKQIQQISEGRMTSTAGQLGMSLIENLKLRSRRSVPVDPQEKTIDDMAELIKVSSSFTLQLVPMSKLGNFVDMILPSDESSIRVKRAVDGASKESLQKESDETGTLINETARANLKTDKSQLQLKANAKNETQTKAKREPLVSRPSSSQQLQATLQEWRQLESRLQFTSTSLRSESSGQGAQMQRLEILRDQIQMRLNEEYMTNKLRRKIDEFKAAPLSSSSKSRNESKRQDIGLALTQLIIDTGITSRRKGSLYSALEEAIDLELTLDDMHEGSLSSLLHDTARIDRLRSHCMSAIASPEQIRAQTARIELRHPFGAADSSSENDEEKSARVVTSLMDSNRRRLNQCKQVSQLLLKVSEAPTADLIIEMMDECNNRMLAGAKNEELGYGPTSRYYRALRQQFVELLSNINRPSESMLDKLVSRLHYTNNRVDLAAKKRTNNIEPEFVYVSKLDKSSSYNKSLLKEEDDYNNNDGAGSLVMTITALTAKSSIRHSKRVNIVDQLLSSLKTSSCLLFNGPDLDILESMANFQEPLDEMVAKVVHLARRCRHLDQYLVACVHGLQGQLQHSITQKFLIEQLGASNVSCTVKSEIMLTLVSAQLANDLKLNLESTNDHREDFWPSSGYNQVDDLLIEIVDTQKEKKYAQDRRCLKQLVAYYLSKKRPISNDIRRSFASSTLSPLIPRPSGRGSRSRRRRSVVNDDNFWDEAQCKRWSYPENTSPNATLNSADSLSDDIDDNSISIALENARSNNSRSILFGSRGKNEKLVERELDIGSNKSTDATLIRKRHKCSAHKTFGPRNAQATLKAEIVNDLIGAKDENKFLARFRLATNFLGSKIDVGRMYLWHQKRTTRAYVNILGKNLWDTSHTCQDKTPKHLLYIPLFDFNLWLLKVSVGLRLHSEMGFFSNCNMEAGRQSGNGEPADDELSLYPSINVRASGEASAKFVVARAGMTLASQYGYQGNIRVSKQPESCMSIDSAHQPMNITLSSWFQLWDGDCHYWGTRHKAEPQATKWRLSGRKASVWIQDECLVDSKNANAKLID